MEDNTYKALYKITGNKLAGFTLTISLPAKFVKQFKDYHNLPITRKFIEKYGDCKDIEDEDYLQCSVKKDKLNYVQDMIVNWKRQVLIIKDYIENIKDVEYVEEQIF